MTRLKIFGIIIFSISLFGCSKDQHDPGQPPVADFTYSQQGATVILSDASRITDGEILSYRWSTDDKQLTISNATQRDASIDISEAGDQSILRVTLTVRGNGQEDSVTKDVAFENQLFYALHTDEKVYLRGAFLSDIRNNPSVQWTVTPELDLYNKNSAPYFYHPVLEQETEYVFTVNTGNAQTSFTESVVLGPFSKAQAYGLGQNITEWKSNDVSYDWYIDQGTTGRLAGTNCGPSSVTMALKWRDPGFNKTAADARAAIDHSSSGDPWWYTNDVGNYLRNNGAPYGVILLRQMNNLKQAINEGGIAILCLDMYYVRQYTQSNQYRYDLFYNATTRDWGHFIVVKGYAVVDGQIWYEVYDPYSMGATYEWGDYKGKDRYYRSEDLYAGAVTSNWWIYAFIINKAGSSAASRSLYVAPEYLEGMAGKSGPRN